MKAVALDLDGALGDTRPLWDAWLADAARRFRTIAELDLDGLPADRGEAATLLDVWAAHGVGDWRAALQRFAEDHAPVYLRPDGAAVASLRRLKAAGTRVGAFTDAPEPLARVALAHLAGSRRIDTLVTGSGARERLLEQLGPDAVIASSADELARAAT